MARSAWIMNLFVIVIKIIIRKRECSNCFRIWNICNQLYLCLNHHLISILSYRLKSKANNRADSDTKSKSGRNESKKAEIVTYSSLKVITPAYTTPEPPSTPDQGGGELVENFTSIIIEVMYINPVDLNQFIYMNVMTNRQIEKWSYCHINIYDVHLRNELKIVFPIELILASWIYRHRCTLGSEYCSSSNRGRVIWCKIS